MLRLVGWILYGVALVTLLVAAWRQAWRSDAELHDRKQHWS